MADRSIIVFENLDRYVVLYYLVDSYIYHVYPIVDNTKMALHL